MLTHNSGLVSDTEPSVSGALARLRGRPPPPPPSAQVTAGSDPAPTEKAPLLSMAPLMLLTPPTRAPPPQLLHLFYDSKAQIFKGWAVNK